MKILTINTHSLQEENYEQKLCWFVESILKERPDIIAMQEVNQTADAPLMTRRFWPDSIPSPVPCLSVRTTTPPMWPSGCATQA